MLCVAFRCLLCGTFFDDVVVGVVVVDDDDVDVVAPIGSVVF